MGAKSSKSTSCNKGDVTLTKLHLPLKLNKSSQVDTGLEIVEEPNEESINSLEVETINEQSINPFTQLIHESNNAELFEERVGLGTRGILLPRDTMHYWGCFLCEQLLGPESCVGCYTFPCYKHAICRKCLLLNLYYIEDNVCYVCQDKMKGENVPRYEARNSLPLLQCTDKQTIRVGPNKNVHTYPTQFKCNSLSHIANTHKELDIPQNVVYTDLINTGCKDKDTIIGCGNARNKPILSIINSNGTQSTITLSEGCKVVSGSIVNKNMYVICIEYNVGCDSKKKKHKLKCINLDRNVSISQIMYPHPIVSLSSNLKYSPIKVFKISKQKYGVLCQFEYRDHKGDIKLINIIMVYPLDCLMLHPATKRHSIQSHILWGRRVIRLEKSDGVYNSICATPRGYFCLSMFFKQKICIYSPTGLYLRTVGRNDELRSSELFAPTSILCNGNGDVVVVGRDGCVTVFSSHLLTSRNVTPSSSAAPDYSNNVSDTNGKQVQTAFTRLSSCDEREHRLVLRNRMSIAEKYVSCNVLSETFLWSIEQVKVGERWVNQIRVYTVK